MQVNNFKDNDEGVVVRNAPKDIVVESVLSRFLRVSRELRYMHSIVVVHGFNSSATGAWKHANGRNWVLDATFWGSLADKARVMIFGYSANAFTDVITSRINDHAEKLLEELFYERRRQKVVNSNRAVLGVVEMD